MPCDHGLLRVACLGDSHTAGSGMHNSYPATLAGLLGSTFVVQTFAAQLARRVYKLLDESGCLKLNRAACTIRDPSSNHYHRST